MEVARKKVKTVRRKKHTLQKSNCSDSSPTAIKATAAVQKSLPALVSIPNIQTGE